MSPPDSRVLDQEQNANLGSTALNQPLLIENEKLRTFDGHKIKPESPSFFFLKGP